MSARHCQYLGRHRFWSCCRHVGQHVGNMSGRHTRVCRCRFNHFFNIRKSDIPSKVHCGLLITKLRLVYASNLQIRQPANWDALANSISVTLDSYGLLPATIPIQTQQLTESSIRLMASTVTCWWWMSSCVMHGYSYVHLKSHPLTRCPHSYGYLALQRVGSYNVTKAVNLPKAPGGACIC